MESQTKEQATVGGFNAQTGNRGGRSDGRGGPVSDAFKRIFIVDDCQTWQREFYEWTISPTLFSNLLSQTWGPGTFRP